MTRIITLLLISTLFWFCSSEPEVPCCSVIEEPKSEPLTDADRVGLVWSDEFDGNTLNTDFWTPDIGDGSTQGIPGWGNNEKQFYTDRAENLRVDDGFLKITARSESFGGKDYTSARIKTQGKFSFTYGRMVVRARLPLSQGTWPAVWMLGESISSVGWPKCGEIDLIEQRGYNKNVILGTAFWFDEATGKNADYSRNYTSEGIGADFRKYTLEWTPEVIRMSVDGIRYYEIKLNSTLPFSDPFFILVNLAMGGNLGGEIGQYFTSDEIWVDYIRVYEN